MNTSEKVKRILNKTGMNQRQFQDLTGIHQDIVSRIANNKKTANEKQTQIIDKLFNEKIGVIK